MKTWKKVLIGAVSALTLGAGANLAAMAAGGDDATSVVDVKGNCDEPEHANDASCAVPQVPEDDDARREDRREDRREADDENEDEAEDGVEAGDDNNSGPSERSGPSESSGPGENSGHDDSRQDDDSGRGEDSGHGGHDDD